MSREFLTEKERRNLQRMYEHFLNTVKTDVISTKFYVDGMLSDHEKRRYDSTPLHEKASYLFHNVIMKSTYSQIKKIRRMLFDEDHQELAQLLIRRNDDYADEDILDWKPGQRPAASSASEQFSEPMDLSSISTQKSQGPSTMNSQQCTDAPKPDGQFSMQESEPAISSAAKSDKSKYNKMQQQQQQQQQQQAGGNQPSGSGQPAGYSLQKHYGVKRPSNRPYGNGMVVIFANFTDHLIGYRNDINTIRGFFTRHMQYRADEQIHVYENLCRAEFMKRIDEVQMWLKNKIPGEFIDRLFVFILSHGNEDGIKMCKPGSAKDEETVDGNLNSKAVYVTVDEIVEKFTHDAVKYLKGFPKCFFLQTCQGESLAKAASDPCIAGRKVGEIDEWIIPPQQITIGADTLVFRASMPGMKSWVPDAGSWFIDNLIDVFELFHQNEDMVSMLTETNDRISVHQCRGEGDKGKVVIGRQMSAFTSTLTKKLYLRLDD